MKSSNQKWPPLARTPWAPALQLLMYGRAEYLAQLLERGRPLHPEAGAILARALRGGEGLPFRLDLQANAPPGKKKAGRLPALNTLRGINIATAVHSDMESGASYDVAVRQVAERFGLGERTVKGAYSKFKELAPEAMASAREATTMLSVDDKPGAKK